MGIFDFFKRKEKKGSVIITIPPKETITTPTETVTYSKDESGNIKVVGKSNVNVDAGTPPTQKPKKKSGGGGGSSTLPGVPESVPNPFVQPQPTINKSVPNLKPVEQPIAAYYRGNVYTSTGKIYPTNNKNFLPLGFQVGQINKTTTTFNLTDIGTGKKYTNQINEYYISKKNIQPKNKINQPIQYISNENNKEPNWLQKQGQELNEGALRFSAFSIGGSNILKMKSNELNLLSNLNFDINKYNKDVFMYNINYANKPEDYKSNISNSILELRKKDLELKEKDISNLQNAIKLNEQKPIELKGLIAEGLYSIGNFGSSAVSSLGNIQNSINRLDRKQLGRSIYNILTLTDKEKQEIGLVAKQFKIQAYTSKKVRENLAPTLLILGATKTTNALNKFFFDPNKIELIALPKTNNVALTTLKSKLIPQGELTKANVLIESIIEPKIVRVTSRVDRVLQYLENRRVMVWDIKPKIYGNIIEGKIKIGGSVSSNAYYLNGKPINNINYLSKNRRQMSRFNRLEGGMSQEIQSYLLDKTNKDIKELTTSLAEARYGNPNILAFGKNKIINLGYQESKEIAKLTNPRKVTGLFGDIIVSQKRSIVYPTPYGKSITRANIAGITEDLKFNKLYGEIRFLIKPRSPKFISIKNKYWKDILGIYSPNTREIFINKRTIKDTYYSEDRVIKHEQGHYFDDILGLTKNIERDKEFYQNLFNKAEKHLKLKYGENVPYDKNSYVKEFLADLYKGGEIPARVPYIYKYQKPDNIDFLKETFVGKDVTFPFKRTEPFKVNGLIIEEKISSNENNVYNWVKGAKPQYQKPLFSSQVIKDLQIKKGGIVNKLVQTTISKSLSSELKTLQKSFIVPHSQSIYYGQGLYERTEGGLSPITKQLQFSFNTELPKTKDSLFLSSRIYLLNNKEMVRGINKNISLEIPKEVSKEIIKLQPKQIEKSITKFITKQVPRQTIKITTIPNLKQLKGYKYVPSIFNNKDNNLTSIFKEVGYKAYIKRFGKIRELPGIFGKGEALQLGENKAINTLAATFGIKKTKFLISHKNNPYKVNERLFRDYRILKGKRIPLINEYIQRRNKRLTTPFEIAEIQSYRRKK